MTTDRIITECEKCDGVAEIKHEQSHTFYNVKFCPFCGEELELEEEFQINDPFEEEYEANNQ
tara:strand:+ start:260 stop:445 length:186 start_codon:yes stop_codon:yes gene_type:complete